MEVELLTWCLLVVGRVDHIWSVVINPVFAYGKTGREQVCTQPSIAEKPLHCAAAVTFW